MLNPGSICTRCGKRAEFVDAAGHCPDCMEADVDEADVLRIAEAMWRTTPQATMAGTAGYPKQPQLTRDLFEQFALAAITEWRKMEVMG